MMGSYAWLSVCLSVHLTVWVCEAYIVHHFNGTALRCALSACVVHHGAQGGPVLEDGVPGYLQVHRHLHSIVFRWFTRYIQIKVHNVVLYRRTLWWSTMPFFFIRAKSRGVLDSKQRQLASQQC